MPGSLAFLLGLLDRHDPAFVAPDDCDGDHGGALRLWQRLGFLSREAEVQPVPSCPSCREGVPYPLGGRLVCGGCRSAVDPRHLLRWRFDLDALLLWLASGLHLKGGVRPVDEHLWQLGSYVRTGSVTECFFRRGGPLSNRGRDRLLAYRHALVLRPLPRSEGIDGFRGPCLSLLELLRQDRRSLRVGDLAPLLHGGGAVRFDAGSGALWAGDHYLGEAPMDSKEYHLIERLAVEQDRFVAYADLKEAVLRNTGSADATDEATFCHKLKRRIKAGVPGIDRLIATTNKGHGYRLRGHVPG